MINRRQYYQPMAPIILRLGGKDNHAISVDVQLSPIVHTSDELSYASELIEDIQQIHLNVYAFSEDTFQIFISKIYELIHLPCLAHASETILNALDLFCRSFVQSSSWNPVPNNFPGHLAHYGELRYRQYLTHFIQDSLMDARFIEVRSDFVIQNFIDEQVLYQKLPISLHDFALSFDDTPYCREQWEQFFHTNSAMSLSYYVANKADEVRQLLLVDPLFVEKLLHKMSLFIEQIRKRSTHFSIHILEDMVGDLCSSERTLSFFSSTKTLPRILPLYHRMLNKFKSKIDKLPNSRAFEDDFHHLRHELSKLLDAYPDHKAAILKNVQLYLSVQDSSKHHTKTMMNYIKRCRIRLSSPVPPCLQKIFDELCMDYSRYTYGQRQYAKLTFLEAWLLTIQAHPEKTYADAYQLTAENHTPPAVRDGFFFERKRHRFNQFVNDMIHYDYVEPEEVNADSDEHQSNLSLYLR